MGMGKKNDWQDIIGTMPSITGEQAAVSTPLSEYLSEAIAGIGTAPTFAEWSTQGGAVPDMFGGPLGSEVQSAYAQALSGDFPEEYFQQSIYQPAMTAWTEDIMPAIQESYVASGAITGTEVGDAVAASANQLQQNLLSVQGQLGYQAQQSALGAAQQYQAQYMQTLQLAYTNYIAQYPDTAQILQAALNYLNIPLMGVYQKPEGMTGGAGGTFSAAPVGL